jgi:hypothetical protein
MKKTIIKNWTRYFLGIFAVSGMLLVSSCDTQRRGTSGTEQAYATEADRSQRGDNMAVSDTTITYDRASNTATDGTYEDASETKSNQRTAPQQGTRTQQGAETDEPQTPETYSVSDRSEYDIERLRMDFDEVNREIRNTLRQYPDVGMRYTDDVEGADYSHGTYGIQYENLTDETARRQFQDLELRRSELHEQMRGHLDEASGTYLSAEVDARPAQGYDALYEFLEEEIRFPRNLDASDIQGTMFVEIRVDERGQVSNPRVIETIEKETVRLESNELNPAPAVANETQVNKQDKKVIIEELEEEVKQALLKTSGMWEPASMEGQAVSETIQLPIRFGAFGNEGVVNPNR